MPKFEFSGKDLIKRRKQMLTHSTLKRRVDMVAERVSKSQEQI